MKRKGPIAWMAHNAVAANLLMILLLGGGLWMATRIQQEVEPEYLLDIVEVRVGYPGASPEEVEKGILLPIEEAVRGVQGIRELVSTAREASGSVSIELVAGADRMRAYQDIDQAVSRIRTFPDEVEQPQVQLASESRRVMSIGIYGDVDVWDLRRHGEQLRAQLLSHPGITQVEMWRVPEYVVHVEIPRHILLAHNLSLGQIAQTIGRSSSDVPAGVVETSAGEILLRLKERKQWAEEFAKIPIVSSESGSPLTLGDIATVSDGFEESGFPSLFNRTPTIDLAVFRVGKESPLAIAKAVNEVIEAFEPTLPEGVQTRVDASAADDYSDRLDLLIENALQAALIVLVILALFLDLSLAFWVMMGMVTSFVGAILFLPLIGVSINMISMFGFLVVLGIVVDDAVVVGENIYEHNRQSSSSLDAATVGADQMARPVFFSILTNIVAFVPLLFMPGTTGKYWWSMPAVVIVVLLLSLFEALFILPSHLAHRRAAGAAPRNSNWFKRRQEAFARGFDKTVERYYAPFLARALRFRYVTVSVAVGILAIVGSFAYSGHMGLIMMPEVAADEIEAGVRLPSGTTPKQAAKVAFAVTDATQRMFEKHNLYEVAEGIKTNVRGGSFVDVEIVMKPPDERTMSANEVIALWREEIGDIDGVMQITFEAERGPGGHRQDISIDIGHDDIDVLEKATAAFVERASSLAETRDVSDNFNRGKAQLDMTLLPAANALGLSSDEIGKQVRDAFFGALALRQLRGTNEIEVRVKLPQDERDDLQTFEDFVIQANGAQVPVTELVSISRSEGFSTINRRNGRRAVSIGMNVEPKSALSRVIEALKSEDLPALRDEFPGLTWSFHGAQAEMRESTSMLWGAFALAIAVIFSLLAVAFGNYSQPLIVLSAIPFGIVGAVLGHLLLGYDLSLVSLMGVVALAGVVVNDALIMIDYANSVPNSSPFESIHQAGRRRFRPILLTTLTTFGGLLPIILETSNQAKHLIPMAISLGFGILFSTAIILFLVPALYLVVDDAKSALGAGRATD